ncbi:MAG: hypothetical protein IIW54_13770, partial [Lachnospiraceae bacterium]|nr:hypothetical protein [Lachnospiraceae bacterium]
MKEPFKLSKEFDDVFNSTLDHIDSNNYISKSNFKKYSAIAAGLIFLFVSTLIGADATGLISISNTFELMFGFESDGNNTALLEELKSDSEKTSVCGDYTVRVVHAIDDGTSGIALIEVKAKNKIFKPDMFIQEYQTKIDGQTYYSGTDEYVDVYVQPSVTVIPANKTIGEAIAEIKAIYEKDKILAEKNLNNTSVSAEAKETAKQSLEKTENELKKWNELLKRFGGEQPINNKADIPFDASESVKEYYAKIWNISEQELNTYTDTLYLTVNYMTKNGFKDNSTLSLSFNEILEMVPVNDGSFKEKAVAKESFNIEWKLSGNSVTKEIPVNCEIGKVGVSKVVLSPLSATVYYSEEVNEDITTVVQDNVIIYEGNKAQTATMIKGVRYKDGSTRIIYADGGSNTASEFNMLAFGKTIVDIDNVQSIFLGEDFIEIPVK